MRHASGGGPKVRTRSADRDDSYGRISYDTRLFVWNRDGGKCRHCGAVKGLHFDHIIPRSAGGSGAADNVELLCAACNLKKGARLFVPGKDQDV